jgi:mevalonate kinase
MTEEIFYSNGKLLLTGEYLVLKRAGALVLPLKIGQSLKVVSNVKNENVILWKAHQFDNLWFQASISSSDFSIINTTEIGVANRLVKIFKAIQSVQPEIFENKGTFEFESVLNFERNWGFGTSSTLITNLALWSHIDPFILFKKVSNGSGYDIAAAQAETPFIYNLKNELPQIAPINFAPPFLQNLFFVYLGRKQDSAKEVEKYIGGFDPGITLVEEVSGLTKKISVCGDFEEFEKLIEMHESLLSGHLNIDTIKKTKFSDFKGTVKSLGAWGGDFVLMTCKEGKEYLTSYLKGKGLKTIFTFDELVRQTQSSSKILI